MSCQRTQQQELVELPTLKRMDSLLDPSHCCGQQGHVKKWEQYFEDTVCLLLHIKQNVPSTLLHDVVFDHAVLQILSFGPGTTA